MVALWGKINEQQEDNDHKEVSTYIFSVAQLCVVHNLIYAYEAVER